MAELVPRHHYPWTPKQEMRVLVVSYSMAAITFAVLMTRFGWRAIRGVRRKDDWLALAAVLPLLVRLALVHVIIRLGTNSGTAKGAEGALPYEEVQRRELGSKLVLAARVLYVVFIWMMKMILLMFYGRLGLGRRTSRFLKCFWWFWGLSLAMVIQSTFLECQPVSLYWTVIPAPGPCILAFGQLITMGILNIITNLALIIIPLPIIIQSNVSLWRKIQLSFLFSLGIFICVVTAVRLPIIVNKHFQQLRRSFWASVEIAVAAIVANTPVLHALIRRAIQKRTRRRISRSISETWDWPDRPKVGRDSTGRFIVLTGASDGVVNGEAFSLTPSTRPITPPS